MPADVERSVGDRVGRTVGHVVERQHDGELAVDDLRRRRGAFDLYETPWHRGLVGTDGWLEMRPMTDGGAPVTIVDS